MGMETLYQAIQTYAKSAYDSNDDNQVVSLLNSESIQKSDAEFKTSRWLMINQTPENAALVLGTMKTAGSSNPIIDAAYQALNSGGIDLSHPLTQQFIDSLAVAGEWPDELRDWLKAQGVWSVSPASEVLGREATLEDVSEVRAWEAGERPVTAMLSVMVQADGRVLLSYRSGSEVVTSADAQNDSLAPQLAHIVSDVLSYMGG